MILSLTITHLIDTSQFLPVVSALGELRARSSSDAALSSSRARIATRYYGSGTLGLIKSLRAAINALLISPRKNI